MTTTTTGTIHRTTIREGKRRSWTTTGRRTIGTRRTGNINRVKVAGEEERKTLRREVWGDATREEEEEEEEEQQETTTTMKVST
jgi:hypothetical protein